MDGLTILKRSALPSASVLAMHRDLRSLLPQRPFAVAGAVGASEARDHDEVGARMQRRADRDLRSLLPQPPFAVAGAVGASEARDHDEVGARMQRRADRDLRSLRSALAGLAIALVWLGAPDVSLAQSSSASYQIPRQTIDGGAQRSTSASYTLDATIGQPDAGPAMSSASYELRGGFHRAAATGPLPDPLFSDGFESP
jgi:hypothetical protein